MPSPCKAPGGLRGEGLLTSGPIRRGWGCVQSAPSRVLHPSLLLHPMLIKTMPCETGRHGRAAGLTSGGLHFHLSLGYLLPRSQWILSGQNGVQGFQAQEPHCGKMSSLGSVSVDHVYDFALSS